MSTLNKKYKILKANSNLLNIADIFKNNSFLAFFQIKHLNFKDLIDLKKTIYSLNLKTFVCKNTYLKKKISFLNLPKDFVCSITQGNLIIIYSQTKLSVLNNNKAFLLAFLQNKLKLIPLFFYFCNKFLFANNFVNLLKSSEKDMFIQLISFLEMNNKNILNNLVLPSKMLINSLNYKK